MKRSKSLILAGLLAWASGAWADDGSGLKISGAVDMAGDFRPNAASQAEDAFWVREAEILLVAPVDPSFDAHFSLAAHREAGEMFAEVHEAYLSRSKLIPRSQIRVGQFFLGIGRLNRVHRHEWPIIFAPRVHEAFFGEEGALDSGLEYAYLLPTPFFLEATLGVTNGWTYGHAHDAGEKPRTPTHYGRLATYFEVPGEGGAQLALNSLRRTDAAGTATELLGLDLTSKWREAGVLRGLLQGEAWLRTQTPKDAKSDRRLGAYLLGQWGLDSQFSLGLMVDGFSVLGLKDGLGRSVRNAKIGITPLLTYKASEFSTLRLGYSRVSSSLEGESDEIDQRLELQANFVIGAHPAHDF